MSRWIEKLPDGTYHEGIADPGKCRWMYDEVCCNDKSPCAGDFADEDDCDYCGLFEKEKEQ